jgi:hypothetical protein
VSTLTNTRTVRIEWGDCDPAVEVEAMFEVS